MFYILFKSFYYSRILILNLIAAREVEHILFNSIYIAHMLLGILPFKTCSCNGQKTENAYFRVNGSLVKLEDVLLWVQYPKKKKNVVSSYSIHSSSSYFDFYHNLSVCRHIIKRLPLVALKSVAINYSNQEIPFSLANPRFGLASTFAFAISHHNLPQLTNDQQLKLHYQRRASSFERHLRIGWTWMDNEFHATSDSSAVWPYMWWVVIASDCCCSIKNELRPPPSIRWTFRSF